MDARKPEVENGISDISYEGLLNPIHLQQDLSGGCGGKTWEAADVMIEYLLWKKTQSESLFDGKRILDLGSGTGLVGLAVASAFPGAQNMTLTDQIPMMELMKQNIILNGLEEKVDTQLLDWGTPLPDHILPLPDVILASDCVYLEIAFQPLVDTLLLLSKKETVIYLSYMKRRNADKRFFQLIRKKFILKEVEDDPKRAVYSRRGLHLYLLTKK
ncbi:putative methyltransferase-domain-containing protein [Phycomyces nitens]|nr:putative methyltransferase-domain-containing protein [Phycomyces nitens]